MQRSLSSWDQYTGEGIRKMGEAYFTLHELDELRLMRLADAERAHAALDYWNRPSTRDVHDRLRGSKAESRKLASRYEALIEHVRERGIPEDIRTSWIPRPEQRWGMFG